MNESARTHPDPIGVNLASPLEGAVVLTDAVWQTTAGKTPRLEQLHWIRFNRRAKISRIRIWKVPTPTSGPLDVVNYPVDFTIQTSPDVGRTFLDLLNVRDNQIGPEDQFSEHCLEPVEADNIRLVVHKALRERWFPYFRNFNEVEILGIPIEPAKVCTPQAREYPATDVKAVRRNLLYPEKGKTLSGLDKEFSMNEGMDILETEDEVRFTTEFLSVGFSKRYPGLTHLGWDNFGNGCQQRNLLAQRDELGGLPFIKRWSHSDFGVNSKFIMSVEGTTVTYQGITIGGETIVDLTFEVRTGGFNVTITRTSYLHEPILESSLLRLPFDAFVTPTAVLALPDFAGPQGLCTFPAFIHAPDFGTLRITPESADRTPLLRIKSMREAGMVIADFLLGEKPLPSGILGVEPGEWSCTLRCEVTGIFPFCTVPFGSGIPYGWSAISSHPALAGLRRAWLNVFGFRPEIGILSNNSVSDNCLFCMYEYADMAVFTPEFAPGFSALDLVRCSLDLYLDGAPGYGLHVDECLDVDPSLLIACWDYVAGLQDWDWFKLHKEQVSAIVNRMLARDRDNDGLLESTRSGNSHSHLWSSNWWDVITFGHKDAFANALAYRALSGCAELFQRVGDEPTSTQCRSAADRIKEAYYRCFNNPDTGVLGGWRSQDEELHDYYFVWVNGIAIAYGVVTEDQANVILNKMQEKFQKVGYKRFDLGLPGNLIPIARKDYVPRVLGSPMEEDGSDSFQYYENGAASASMSYWYIQALYSVGRRQEANEILFPMLKRFGDGEFQAGIGSGVDWKTWDGKACGYEGLLVDQFYALLAAITGFLGLKMTIKGVELRDDSPLKGEHVTFDFPARKK
jgi:hypothetical protein